MLVLDVRNDEQQDAPEESLLRESIQSALRVAKYRKNAEVSVCILGSDAMRELNHNYRDRDRSTNVLSFPADLPVELQVPHLGDIVICAPLVASEAREQSKTVDAHWAHLLIHGTLHLLGYDHADDAHAEVMEALESRALEMLGWPCPYREPQGSTEVAS